jgi:uncharacterized protein (TIGR02118 family)
MILVSVMYPSGEGSTFDERYYLQEHVPLVKERWNGMGLQEVRLGKGLQHPDGSTPPYRLMALLTFRSMQDGPGDLRRHPMVHQRATSRADQPWAREAQRQSGRRRRAIGRRI